MSRALIVLFTRVRSIIGIPLASLYTLLASIAVLIAGSLGQTDLATKLMRAWGRGVLFLFGIHVECKGEENLPKVGGGIAVFNHQSLFDIPVIMQTTYKTIRFGAKIELFRIPFFGAAMRAAGTLPIARENRTEVLKVYREAEKHFANNFIFLLAPEGTRQNEPRLGRFKKGPFVFATNAGVPVIPIVIKGAHEVLPKGNLTVNIGRIRRTIHVRILPAISTKEHTTREIDPLVEKTRSAMVEAYESMPG